MYAVYIDGFGHLVHSMEELSATKQIMPNVQIKKVDTVEEGIKFLQTVVSFGGIKQSRPNKRYLLTVSYDIVDNFMFFRVNTRTCGVLDSIYRFSPEMLPALDGVVTERNSITFRYDLAKLRLDPNAISTHIKLINLTLDAIGDLFPICVYTQFHAVYYMLSSRIVSSNYVLNSGAETFRERKNTYIRLEEVNVGKFTDDVGQGDQ